MAEMYLFGGLGKNPLSQNDAEEFPHTPCFYKQEFSPLVD